MFKICISQLNFFTRREAIASPSTWIHFKALFDGLHTAGYNSAESEPIWMKFRTLWAKWWGLAMADFDGTHCRHLSNYIEPSVYSGDAPNVKLLSPLVIFGRPHRQSHRQPSASSRVLYCRHSTQYSHLVLNVNTKHCSLTDETCSLPKIWEKCSHDSRIIKNNFLTFTFIYDHAIMFSPVLYNYD